MQLYSGVSTHFVNQAIGNQIAYALADNFPATLLPIACYQPRHS